MYRMGLLLPELADEVLDSILAWVPDFRSLAHAEESCRRLRARVAADDLLWRQHVLAGWSWIVSQPPVRSTAQRLPLHERTC